MKISSSDLSIENSTLYYSILKKNWFFEYLSEEESEFILHRFKLLEVKARRWVIHENEPSDGIIIVLSGRCRAYRNQGGIQTEVGEISQGEVLGETTILNDQPRSASVATLRDCVFAWLPKKVLLDILEKKPRIWQFLGKIAAERSLSKRKFTKSLVLLIRPRLAGLPMVWLIEEFKKAMSPFGPVGVLRAEDVGEQTDIGVMINHESLSLTTLLLIADLEETEWTLKCIRSSDRLVTIFDAQAPPPKVRQQGYDTLVGGEIDISTTQHLILLQPENISIANGTAEYLEAFKVDSHHHIRLNNSEDAARAIRLLNARGLGVVFGGASSRGIAHAGTVGALKALNISVDAVGGSSSGAGAAVGLAMGLTESEIMNDYTRASMGIKPKWYRYIPPLVAMMNGYRTRKTLKSIFGDARLEDLLIPCTTTAVDVKSAEIFYFTKGEVWLAVRATMSLPGYFPPVVQDNRVLIDGGIASNLPIECVSSGCKEGLTLAFDLLPGENDDQPFSDVVQYGDYISGWALFFKTLWPFSKPPKYPSLMEILIYAIMIPNRLKLRHDREKPIANVKIVRPPIGNYGFFDVGPKEGIKLAMESHQNMLKLLPEALSGSAFEDQVAKD